MTSEDKVKIRSRADSIFVHRVALKVAMLPGAGMAALPGPDWKKLKVNILL